MGIFKKIAKFVKRGLKKVGSFLKRAFKKVGSFIGKLGPVGMLGMMIMMPQMGAWWKSFGDWAGALKGPLGKVMEGIHWAGGKVGDAYSSITETISAQIKKIPGVGEAYEGLESWVGEKLDDVRGALGVEQSGMAPTTSTEVQTDELYSGGGEQQNNWGGDASGALNPDGTLRLDPRDSYRSIMADPRQSNVMTHGADDLFGTNPGEEWYSGKNIGDTNFVADTTGSVEAAKKASSPSWIDKAKDIYEGVSAVKGTIEEVFGSDEEEQVFGGVYVAENMVPILGVHDQAKADWTNQGYVGQPGWGIGNSEYIWSLIDRYEARSIPFQGPGRVTTSTV